MRGVLALVVCLSVACGSKTAPSNTGLSGTWTGNVEFTQGGQRAALAVLTEFSQAGATVTGTWGASVVNWSGTVSGTQSGSAFTGTFTISLPGASGLCTGTASVSGPVGQTLRWTSVGFVGTCTNMPLDVVFNLQR